MDSSGEQHLQLDHYIYKRRLDLDGIPLEDAVKVDITSKDKEVNYCRQVLKRVLLFVYIGCSF